MSKMVQVRDVSDDVHSTLKARAAKEKMNLSDYLKRELERIAERPTLQEWMDVTSQFKPIDSKVTSAQIIRELRESE